MSAVSKNVIPASSAASTTARVAARSSRLPKLLQPSPRARPARSEPPRREVTIRQDMPTRESRPSPSSGAGRRGSRRSRAPPAAGSCPRPHHRRRARPPPRGGLRTGWPRLLRRLGERLPALCLDHEAQRLGSHRPAADSSDAVRTAPTRRPAATTTITMASLSPCASGNGDVVTASVSQPPAHGCGRGGFRYRARKA